MPIVYGDGTNGTYKPTNTVLGNQPINPNQVYSGDFNRVDLSNLGRLKQTRSSNQSTASPITNSPNAPQGNQPNSPASSSTLSSAARGFAPMILGVLLQKPVSDLGDAFSANVTTPYTNKVDEFLGLRPDPAAKKALENATKRYELALKNRQAIQQFKSKGSQSTRTGFNHDVPSGFNPLDKADGWYRVYQTQLSPDGFAAKEALTDPATTFSWRYDDPSWLKIVRFTVNGVEDSQGTGADGSDIFDIKWYRVVLGQIVAGFPPVAPYNPLYTPPSDRPKVKDQEKNPAASPDYFPWSPTIQIDPNSPYVVKPKDSPAYDNRPYKEPEKPLFSPNQNPTTSPTPPTSPTAAPNNGIGSQPANTQNDGMGGFVSTPATQTYANGMTNADYERLAKQTVKTGPTNSETSPSQNKNPLTDPLNPPKTDKPQTTPNTPSAPDLGNIALGLTGLGLTLGAIATGIDYLKNLNNQINNQTTPTAQKANVADGVCQSMQPNQCGYAGVKAATTAATNPIKEQAIANAGLLVQILAAIANLASTIANLFSNVVGKLDGIKTFLEKVASAAKLDKIYNVLTFITVIHNAQILSSSLAVTLMDTLSLGLATCGIKDENDSPIDIQSIINKSVEDKVKEIVGVANYTTLSDRWKAAVRVYQAAANITYQVRSLWDSAKSLAELTGANVGKIGNALRRDGVVSENAYGAMADNPMMVNSPMTKLQNLDEAASHMNSIASEGYGMTETVAQIKKDQDDFKKLVKEGTSSTTPIVNDQQKAKDDAAKIASVSPSISTTDLSKP